MTIFIHSYCVFSYVKLVIICLGLILSVERTCLGKEFRLPEGSSVEITEYKTDARSRISTTAERFSSVSRSFSSELRDVKTTKPNVTTILVMSCRYTDDIELISVLSVLRRAKVNNEFAGLKKVLYVMKLESDLLILPDADMDVVMNERPYDYIILPGGKGYINYFKSRPLKRLLREQSKSGRFIGAMSTAPLILQKYEIGNGRSITMRPTWKNFLYNEYNVVDYGVVHDGNIITCEGAAVALEYAFYLVQLVKGKEVADEIATTMGFRRNMSNILIIPPHKNK